MASKKPPDKQDTKKPSASEEKCVAQPYPKTTVTIEIPRWLFLGVSSFVCFMAIVVGSYFTYDRVIKKPVNLKDILQRDASQEGDKLFNLHDRNKDGYLSRSEFQPLLYRLLEVNFSSLEHYSQTIDDDDEVITIHTHFIPLLMETMTKEQDIVFGSTDTLHGLKTWVKPATEYLNFGARHFHDFLPNYETPIELGKVYWIVESPTKSLGSSFSSNRYYPPKIDGRGIIIHRLLTLFHPHPFILSRFGPQGSVATVKAYNDEYVEVVFRIHAEFQLNAPPYYPMWFTPAQFTGSIIMTRDSSRVIRFNMAVPTDKKLNVDMEWLNGPVEDENMEVDLGYLPLMVLNNTAPSMKIPQDELYLQETEHPPDPDLDDMIKNIKWSEKISYEEVTRLLEVKMYPFKNVPYYNFTTALDKAASEQKLVHSIVLWGALDDQSC